MGGAVCSVGRNEKLLHPGRIVIEQKADRLDDGRLARSSRSNDAVQTLTKFERNIPEMGSYTPAPFEQALSVFDDVDRGN